MYIICTCIMFNIVHYTIKLTFKQKFRYNVCVNYLMFSPFFMEKKDRQTSIELVRKCHTCWICSFIFPSGFHFCKQSRVHIYMRVSTSLLTRLATRDVEIGQPQKQEIYKMLCEFKNCARVVCSKCSATADWLVRYMDCPAMACVISASSEYDARIEILMACGLV